MKKSFIATATLLVLLAVLRLTVWLSERNIFSRIDYPYSSLKGRKSTDWR